MLFDDKKLVSVIVAGMGKGKYEGMKHENEEMRMEDPYKKEFSPGYEQAAYEMIAAFKSEDPIRLAYSLKNFIEMCKNEQEY